MKEQSGYVYTGFQHDEQWIGRHGEYNGMHHGMGY